MPKLFFITKQFLENKFYIILNPNAGKGATLSNWTDIMLTLNELDFDYEYQFIEDAKHCQDIVKIRIKEGYRKFICVGGDGTLNLIINAFFSQTGVDLKDIFLGHIPMGTGNDWRKYFNLPHNYIEAIHIIKKQQVFRQDVGQILYSKDGEPKKAFFMNISGIGFDAEIAKTTNKIKNRGNRTSFAYLRGLFTTLLKYKYVNLRIEINNEILEGEFLSLSIGNGKYSGSGMIQTPNAIIDDGLLDVTLYEKMSKLKVITNIKKLYNGKVIYVKEVKTFRTESIKISSDQKIFAETDGEIIPDGPYEISIIPKVLNVYI